ncbi:MAG: hypothetical protein M9933_05200 [Chitinophagaceae bacterium]|nr:hypothetical protein [Chitinophagaceae bacterium]
MGKIKDNDKERDYHKCRASKGKIHYTLSSFVGAKQAGSLCSRCDKPGKSRHIFAIAVVRSFQGDITCWREGITRGEETARLASGKNKKRRRRAKKEKGSDEGMEGLNLKKHKFHGDWSYTIMPGM